MQGIVNHFVSQFKRLTLPPSRSPSPSAAPSNHAITPPITTFTAMRYTLLTTPKNSIRVAILHPGEREAAINVTIQQVEFVDRPQYHALSYAWGKPGDDKGITVNGSVVGVRSNLHAALLHLRDPKEERVLWIDAICIDQSNIEERNQQVALMAYIYARASMVTVWLGVLDASSERSLNRCWGCICKQPYWQRLWIVQEVGAAATLTVEWEEYYGPSHRIGRGLPSHCVKQSYSWDAFFATLEDKNIKATLPYRLNSQRELRYGDASRLANLINIYQESLCEDPRDKIYGLVGIASDCQDGNFPIDYSKSYYEVYQDAMRFYHGESERRGGKGFATLVLFSQVVQRVLGGVEALERNLRERNIALKPFQRLNLSDNTSSQEILTISGLACGPIREFGPTYDAILGDPRAWSNWKALISKCTGDAEALRKKNEYFLRALVDLSKEDLRNITAVNTTFCFPMAGKVTSQLFAKGAVFPTGRDQLWPPFVTPRSIEEDTYRLFTTPNGIIGLAAGNVEIGDFLVQFVGCDIVAVLRYDPERHYLWQIVGRAIIPNVADGGSWKCDMPPDEDSIFRMHPQIKRPTFVDKLTVLKVDMMTLQFLTS